jgi:uncharacterized protein (DUF488 family)
MVSGETQKRKSDWSSIPPARILATPMCSEGLWWRCHRRRISDRLLLAGWQVMHVLPDGKLSAHTLPDFATVADGRLLYNKPSAGD